MSVIEFAVKPRPGDKHQRFLDHVRDNLCNGNLDRYQYLLDWMARAVQKPDAPGEVAVVFQGPKGTGKSLFAKVFGALFGRHYQVSYGQHLTGNFNAHLRDCVVLFADEALRDKKCESVLKMLLTEETIVIERKGDASEDVPNHVHLIMASNEPWSASAADARRFFVLDVAALRVQDNGYFDYFSAVDADLKAGGYGHLLHALQTRDISNFSHRTVPEEKQQ